MPIYEYVCEKCGDHVEVLQKVSDPPLKRCKKCRGKMEKLVSRTAFQLKGSGWYKTDYAAKTPQKGKAEKSADAKSESAKSETGSSTTTSGGAASKD
ncbi:MAG TPA: FmdB family zinc ribbon protein [Blastocatellia bacterium]|nr:FmdB family zinc ribbon protein [Blastocatellia bacterium]